MGGTAQDAVARKKRSAEEGVLLELTPHFLEQTELKRWPDYHFLIGQSEPGVIARKQGVGQSSGFDVTSFFCWHRTAENLANDGFENRAIVESNNLARKSISLVRVLSLC